MQMFICACIRTAVMVGYVVVLLQSGCTTGPVCFGVLLSYCSAFCGASGGHRGDIRLGHAKLSQTLLSVRNRHILLLSVCLFIVNLLLNTTADTAANMHTPLLFSQRDQTPNVSERVFAGEQVLMLLPQGQNGHFCTPLSAKLCADITIYHPPAHTMFGSLFNIYMTTL